MKRKYLLFLVLLLPLAMNGAGIGINGIWYNLNTQERTAEVTQGGNYVGAVTIPNSVTYDGVTYSVTSIGMSAFDNCSGLTSMTIPNSVTSIGMMAFSNCINLTSVNIPSSVTSIGLAAFYRCVKLSSISIPSSVTSIGMEAFENCSGLTSIEVNPANPIYDSRDNCNAIIETASNKLILGCKNTVIPNSVTCIGRYSFNGCTFDTITIPEGVTTIEGWSFEFCSLSSITIPASVTSIGNSAFFDCNNLTSVTVLNPVPVTITETTFNTRGQATLYVPTSSRDAYLAADYWNGFNEIKENSAGITINGITYELNLQERTAEVTQGANNLESAVILSTVTSGGITCSVTSIRNSAFNERSSLTSVTIPNSVTSIGMMAFFNCANLISLNIPSSVTSIGIAAFYGCVKVPSISIPSSVTSIGIEAFENCSGLTSVEVNPANPIYDSRDNCNAIIETASNKLILGCKNTVIPNSVTCIGKYSFNGCTFDSFTIPEGVTTIEGWSFEFSTLSAITIPASVTSIGNNTFFECNNLTSFTVLNPVPIAVSEDFFSDRGQATLYVPDGSIDSYLAAEYWNGFKEIKGISTITSTSCPDDHHPHVIDLGLPSGTKWACCNVGADTPEGYGSYFAWGEVKEKSNYSWETYSHCDKTKDTCHNLGSDIANSEYYDAAYVNMGMSWIMPTNEQLVELVENCTSEWTTVNDIDGRKFVGPNGNSIFLPAPGYREDERLRNNGNAGLYWASTQHPSKSDFAYYLLIRPNLVECDTWCSRYYGQSVRPVANVLPLQLSESNIVLAPGEDEFVDILSGNGSYSVASSNSNVATATIVESSVIITAVGDGTATIIVTDTQSGETATIAVTVTKNAPVVHLQLSENYAGMVLEEESSVDILSGSGRYTVTSSNPDVATATIEGSSVKINAVGAGSATITVKDMASEEIAHIQVTVVAYLYNPLTPSSPSPSNNVANVAPYGMFTWMISYYNGGKDIHYDLYLDTNSSFSNINGKPYHSGTGNSCSFSGLQPNTKYYWKVKVYNDKGQYAISDVWSFTTREKRLVTSTLRGDVNNDNMVSIADVMMMVNYIIGKPVSANFMAFNADVNSDASITITDVMKVVQIIIYGETAEPYLVVWHKDGSKIMFNLNEKPKVTYLGDNVTINGATTVECAFQAIRKMTFEKIEKPSSLLTVPFVNDGETVTFLPADKDLCVKVILPKGKLVKEFVVKKGEKATLPLDASTAKTYSMDVNGVTYKIKTR